MRLFVALNLDPAVREAIAAAVAPLREAAPGLAWVAADRLHLTLKFLGERADEAVPELRGTLEDLARRHRPFGLDLKGVGAFPNFRRARVVWLGVDAEPRLELLQHDVEERLAAIGYELEGRPFRPHLTLARVRRPEHESVMRELARAARAVGFHTEVDVTSVDLMRSTLGASGSRYDLLHAAPLAARED